MPSLQYIPVFTILHVLITFFSVVRFCPNFLYSFGGLLEYFERKISSVTICFTPKSYIGIRCPGYKAKIKKCLFPVTWPLKLFLKGR